MSFGLFNPSFITILNYRLRGNKDEYKLMEMDQQEDELSEYVQYNVIHIILLCIHMYFIIIYIHNSESQRVLSSLSCTISCTGDWM